jgi:DNA-binding transcriptional LysR family regulator
VQREHHFQGLTPEGERMLEWAHRILADCDGMQRDLVAMRDGLTGRLRLGAIPTTLPSIALLTAPLRRRHEGVTLTVESLTSREIEKRLHEFELDVGLTYLENEPLRGVRSLALYRERYVFLTRAVGRYAAMETIAWEDAAAAPLCLLSRSMQNRRIVDRLFASVGTAPEPVLETNSIATLYSHVRDQQMHTVMAHTWLRLFGGVPAGMRAIPLVEPDASQQIGLVWLDRDPEPLLARALVNTARENRLEALLDHGVPHIPLEPAA